MRSPSIRTQDLGLWDGSLLRRNDDVAAQFTHTRPTAVGSTRDRVIPTSEVKDRLQGCIYIRPWLRTPVL